MSDDKWTNIQKHVESKNDGLAKADKQDIVGPQPGNFKPLGAAPESQGLIEKFQTGRIQRQNRIEALREHSNGQREVWKKYVAGQVLVSGKRIDAQVEAQLEQIWRVHLESLREIGISNYEDRMHALQDLSERTARELKRVEAMDVPPFMKEKLLDAVVANWRQLFQRIDSEEIRHIRESDKS